MAQKNLPKGITKRADGRYMGRFQYEGERYTLYDDDLEKLKIRIEDMKYELRHGIYEREQNITVDNWFKTWMKEYKKPSVKEITAERYISAYEQHVKKAIGKKKLKDIRPEHIQRIYNEMNKKFGKEIISLTSVVLYGLFQQAYKNQIIKKNPVALTTLPKSGPHKKRRVLTVEEQKLLLQFADGMGKDMMEVALSTGMRSGELRGLEWSDIDFTERVIHITGTLTELPGSVFKGTPKTASSKRDIPMLDNVYGILKRVKKEQAEYRLLMGNHWKTREGLENLVFTNKNGTFISNTWFSKMVQKAEDAIRDTGIEFEHVHPHSFRHTFATRCIENGMPPQVLKAILGHSTLAMTMDLYSHVLPDTKAEEIQKIANLF
ncbi:MAG: tyrosine-type recombinase/integrase [Lachnospiraceae bacterium]|jgi:integrase